MPNTHKIRQFDELPSWTFRLSYDTAENTWPPLNSTDVVTIIARAGAATPILHKVPASARTDATRTIRWDFTSSQTALAGTYSVWTRVTQADGRSYTHPLEGSDTLTITAAGATTDVADPA